MTYEEIIFNIQNGINFSFSRFGDGEFACMEGHKGKNCDGHEYFPDLGKSLKEAWNNPRGVVAVQRLARQMFHVHGDYPDADVLHRASINGELDKLFRALQYRKIIVVGPDYLGKLRVDAFFLYVPAKNAWTKHEHVVNLLSKITRNDDVILFCCGMMAEVLIWELYDEKYTMMDCGSVFDPYVGRKTRTYHHKLKL